ncbi:MAG: hypothetical protein K0R92_610 [Lachnospiraceae bacterium]|jgi:DNA internalization-related competence protein ComEC/Rec2|nr:hypothetical protein [Lachnospiraceae bacterium]
MMLLAVLFAPKDLNNELPASLQTQEQQDNNAITNHSDNLADALSVHFIDVGQGDSILIGASGHYMLIDAGENEEGKTVVNYLKEQGVETLEYVIGTHPHSDHIGGLDTVINNFQISKIILPDVTNNTKTFEEVLDAIAENGLKITKPKVGTEYKLGDGTFIIMAPNSSEYSDINNYSVVIKLVYGETSFLLTGDAEKISEEEMLENGLDLSANVLKLGHHGSSYSSSDSFLDAVGASSAIISVGRNNKYGHPMEETVNRILERGIKIYRTDESGTIVATSDGSYITFNHEPGETRNTTIPEVTATTPPASK